LAAPSTVTGSVNNNFAAAPDDASMSMVLDVPVEVDLIMILPPTALIVAPVIPLAPPNAVIQAATVLQFAVKALVTAEPLSTFRTRF